MAKLRKLAPTQLLLNSYYLMVRAAGKGKQQQ